MVSNMGRMKATLRTKVNTVQTFCASVSPDALGFGANNGYWVCPTETRHLAHCSEPIPCHMELSEWSSWVWQAGGAQFVRLQHPTLALSPKSRGHGTHAG